ncbi:uncharacterized protein N7518_004733 [Penicillium psychrosexuale]|uniref:uncharacterized protein n=1 Tax=Penicillium psychrosexuale TaxID=1002107 RepID=UPI0025452EC9|nr:uncharacterized protein N7518_004733 [Penicillium psychrosexuale]KAJ5796193.1 hypothetical protein N7518_004733 [Penicillium psychrosexuale]
MPIGTKIFLPLRGRVGIRSFSSSGARWESTALPASKPVGAFRGGVFGFLTGSVAAGALVYYYILTEYRLANETLSEDIAALQKATMKLQTYITELESRVDTLHNKK